MRVAIVGSRDFPESFRVTQFVIRLARKYPDAVVISGGAHGVDKTAAKAAERMGLGLVEFLVVKHHVPAQQASRRLDTHFTNKLDWNERARELLGIAALDYWADWCDSDYVTFRDAAFARNTWIVKAADQVVAFHDGKSSGTANTIREARRLHVPVHINP